MKRMLAAVCVFCFWGTVLSPASELVVRSIRLQPLGQGEAKMTVTLESRATLVLYYDSVQPARPDVLETFWFSETSDARTATHSFILRELEPGVVYYFRLASSWPGEFRTGVMRWTIPKDSKDDVIIK